MVRNPIATARIKAAAIRFVGDKLMTYKVRLMDGSGRCCSLASH